MNGSARHWLRHKRPPSRSVLGQPDVRNVPVFIYGLTDPDSGIVRYIGKSQNPRKRIASHMHRTAAAAVFRWTSGLRKRGKRPGLVILHEVPPGENADPHEIRIIREFRPRGCLLNAHFSAERSAA